MLLLYNNNYIDKRQKISYYLGMGLLQDERLILDIAKRVADKLNKQIAMGHETFAFSIVIGVAVLKDLVLDPASDFAPIVGQIVLSLPVSAFLMYFLWGKGYFNKQKGRIFWWLLGIFIDTTWLFNLIPITTVTVLMAWRTVHKKGIKAQVSLDKLHEKTLEELEKIEIEADED